MAANKTKTWLMAGIFTLSCVLSGCASTAGTAGPDDRNETKETPAATKEAAQEATKALVKLEITSIDWGSKLPEGGTDYIKKKLDEKLTTDIGLNTFASQEDYKNQLNMRMASGNYPDIMELDRVQMQQFGKKGLLLDLTPYLDQLKPVVDFIGEDSLKKGMVDGKVFAIAKRPQIPYHNIWIRKDWLDKLKLKPPTTLDEFVQVAKAFTEQDPDGNNKKDTYGLTGKRLSAFQPIFGAYGVGIETGGAFYLKDGKLVNTFTDPGMKDALTFIKQLIDTGAVDPDLLANTGNQDEKKAYQGKVGMIWADFPKFHTPAFVEEYKAVNPNAEWMQIAPPTGPGGQFAGAWDIGKAPTMHGISKSVEKDPAKLQRILELLNYLASDEGATLVAHGEEGRHWNRENGKIVRTDLRAKEILWMYQLLGRDEMAYLQSGYPVDVIEMSASTPRIEILNGFLDLPEGYSPADANRYIEEELSKFIYGKRPIGEYDAFVQTLDTTFKYKLMTEAAAKQLTELKIIQ